MASKLSCYLAIIICIFVLAYYYIGYGSWFEATTSGDMITMGEWLERQELRKVLVERTCHKFRSKVKGQNYKNVLIYNRQHNLTFCGNAKVRDLRMGTSIFSINFT